MWIRSFMQTTFIFLVTMTALVQESVGNTAQWIRLVDGGDTGRGYVLEAEGNRIYDGAYGIYVSDDQGLTWRYVVGVKHSLSSMAIDGNTVYVGTYSGGMFRSDDAGETWKPIRNGLRVRELNDGTRYWGKIHRILVNFDGVIVVAYHAGTYVSNNQGETWHDVSDEWNDGNSIWSMTQFDGYLWGALSISGMYRSSDNGRTWEWLPDFKAGRVNDWTTFYNRLYVAGEKGIGRWNDKTQMWEYLMAGLPTGHAWGADDPPFVFQLAVHDGRLFAGLHTRGVYVFDERSKTWSAVGLDGLSIHALLSHESVLYAGTGEDGIYCTSLMVQPHGKVVTTWASVKQGALAK